jgi:hypothetical protein
MSINNISIDGLSLTLRLLNWGVYFSLVCINLKFTSSLILKPKSTFFNIFFTLILPQCV